MEIHCLFRKKKGLEGKLFQVLLVTDFVLVLQSLTDFATFEAEKIVLEELGTTLSLDSRTADRAEVDYCKDAF